MSKEIIIGSGEVQTSAVHIFRIEGKHSISENGGCYWISNLILDFSMKIFKDTPEGKKLTRLIDYKVNLPDILRYLNKLVLENSNHEKLIDYIENTIQSEKEKSFIDGRNSIKIDFNNLLKMEF